MRDEELQRVLAKNEEIAPSSGFTQSVMGAVRREAATPPPLAFPLWRALPGWAAAALTIALAVAAFVREARMPTTIDMSSRQIISVVEAWLVVWSRNGGGWILLGLVVSFVAVKLSVRAISGGLSAP
jgi:hypothetical protein